MRCFDENRVGTLIDSFYEAAARPQLWRDLLAQMAAALGAEGCTLTPGVASPLRPVCSASMDEGFAAGVAGGWFDGENNVRMARGAKLPQDVKTEAMLFTPWELDHLPYNAEFVNRFGYRHFAAMLMAKEGPSRLAFSVERLTAQGPFSEPEIDTLRRLAPHVQRAGQLASRLAERHHDGLMDAFAAFDCGAVLLDWRGRVRRLNAKAEALMGPWLTVHLGALTAGSKDCDAALQKLIGSAVARGPQRDAAAIGAVAITRPFARPLLVHAAPLTKSAQDLFQQAQAALMIIDPDQDRTPERSTLRQLFGLTVAEAAIAAALSCGRDIDEIAQMRGVLPGTIRNQSLFMIF
jgi:PAS domain-containing protein